MIKNNFKVYYLIEGFSLLTGGKMRFLLLVLLFTGCATVVDSDYGQYLNNNLNMVNLKKKSIAKNYYQTKNSRKHSRDIKSFTTGIGNKWTIKFGPIMDTTLASKPYVAAFGSMKKLNDKNLKDTMLINLLEYDFRDHRAVLEFEIKVYKNKKLKFEKTYKAMGKSQGGKMFWAGAAGMKNAIQQSTMMAMNETFSKFSKEYK